MPLKIEPYGGGVKVYVKVVPGSSRDRIVGELGDTLKIAVSAPPEGGKANDAVIKLLVETLGLSRQNVTILSGHGNPRKQVAISGLPADEIRSRLGV